MAKFSIPCVILAGGKSSRMGRDKSLLPFEGYATLAEYQYRRMQELFETVYLSAKDPEKFGFEATCIVDETAEGFAPTYALAAILRQVESPAVFVMAVDMPFLSEAVISRLLSSYRPELPALLAKESGRLNPLCAVYAKSLLPAIDEAIRQDRHKLQAIALDAGGETVEIDDACAFTNLNHPEEYDAACSR